MLLVGLDGCEVRLCGPCAFVRPRVPCVLEVTQTHIHIHTHTFTPWRVPRGGGLEGRHAHGELEAHGGSGEEYFFCRDSRAMDVQGRFAGSGLVWAA